MFWMKCIIMVLPLILGNRNVLDEVHYNDSSADHGNRSDLDGVPYHRELNGMHYDCSSADCHLGGSSKWVSLPNRFPCKRISL